MFSIFLLRLCHHQCVPRVPPPQSAGTCFSFICSLTNAHLHFLPPPPTASPVPEISDCFSGFVFQLLNSFSPCVLPGRSADRLHRRLLIRTEWVMSGFTRSTNTRLVWSQTRAFLSYTAHTLTHCTQTAHGALITSYCFHANNVTVHPFLLLSYYSCYNKHHLFKNNLFVSIII